ncbi:MAG: acyltransferase family protein [Terriglobales bacterium]
MAATIVLPKSAARPTQGREVSLDYLRATVTLLVIVSHSAAAYAMFSVYDNGHNFVPVVDASRSLVFDFIFYLVDNFPMCLLFLVSGLFVLPGIRSHGTAVFLRNRLLRLGVPFAATVTFIMPLAYYAGWRADGHAAGYLNFWRWDILAGGWPCGPLWMIWELLFFDFLAAAVIFVLPRAKAKLNRPWEPSPILGFSLMFLAAALAFIPLAIRFGVNSRTPLLLASTGWRRFPMRPFYFQASRALLYLFWFAVGVLLGRKGLASSPLAPEGPLAKRWPWWLAWAGFCYSLFFFLFMGGPNFTRWLNLPETAGTVVFGLFCVLSSTACCFGVLALFRGAIRNPSPWMDSLARCAYVIYLVHYAFVVWIQYYLLAVPLPVMAKFAITLTGATGLSWLSARLVLRVPGLKRVV